MHTSKNPFRFLPPALRLFHYPYQSAFPAVSGLKPAYIEPGLNFIGWKAHAECSRRLFALFKGNQFLPGNGINSKLYFAARGKAVVDLNAGMRGYGSAYAEFCL